MIKYRVVMSKHNSSGRIYYTAQRRWIWFIWDNIGLGVDTEQEARETILFWKEHIDGYTETII